MKSDDMNKQESYKTYMILMISSDGNQNNVFFISARYRSPFCQVFGSPLSASLFLGKFGAKKIKLSFKAEIWYLD